MASAFCDLTCKYPEKAHAFYENLHGLPFLTNFDWEHYRARLLSRAARYRVWQYSGNLSYLQRLGHVNADSANDSIFSSPQCWRKDVTFSSPSVLSHVKDDPTKKYLNILSIVRDGYVGILEGSPSEIIDMVNILKDRRKDILQDIRKGHVLDRYPQSSINLVHELRMHIEYFLFQKGPDPERSSHIDKCLQSESDPIIEALFPYLGCIVDTSTDFLTSEDASIVRKLAPNIPVIVPAIYIGSSPIGRLISQTTDTVEPPVFSYEYVLDPLILQELRFDEIPADEVSVGTVYTLTRGFDEQSSLSVRVVDMSPAGVPTVVIL